MTDWESCDVVSVMQAPPNVLPVAIESGHQIASISDNCDAVVDPGRMRISASRSLV